MTTLSPIDSLPIDSLPIDSSPINLRSLYQTLLTQLAEGPVIVATVIVADVPSTASTAVGHKLLIWGDANTAGQLSPAIAAMLIPPAFEVMKTGLPQRITLTQEGTVDIWLARWQGADAIATAQAILSSLDRQSPQRLVIPRLVIPLVSGQTAYVIDSGQSLRNLQGQNAYIEDIREHVGEDT